MRMRVHELHAAVIHAPLVLLPSATVADVLSLGGRDSSWTRVGRTLWAAGMVSGWVAGWAGLAASQEVKAGEAPARDMMFLHGLGNALITTGAVAMTLWRLRHPPTVRQCLVGLTMCGAVLYTASLGGKLVYDYGVGVASQPHHAPQGVRLDTPPLFSREAPRTLARDAMRGLGWLLLRMRDVLTRREPLQPGAKGFGVIREPPGPYAPAHGTSSMPTVPSPS